MILNFFLPLISFFLRSRLIGFFIFYFSFLLNYILTFFFFYYLLLKRKVFLFYLISFYNDYGLFFQFDNFSMIFLILNNLIFLLILLYSYILIEKEWKLFFFFIGFLNLALILFFSIGNIFFFFLLLELTTLPLFLFIGLWGSRLQRIDAAFFYFLYTGFGSILFLFSFFCFFSWFNIYNFSDFMSFFFFSNLLFNKFNFFINKLSIISIFLFLGFGIKVPLFPFHFWLTEAHVEAPTVGSVLLAGIMLKLGSYGFFRFFLPILPFILLEVKICFMLLSILSIFFCSFMSLRQVDLKKIVAYSSIIHMNVAILGILSSTKIGILGSLLYLFSHGIVASALFFLIGFLYNRVHSRDITDFGNLFNFMPFFSFFFLLFSFLNAGLPISGNFSGEFFVLFGLFQESKFFAILVTFLLSFSSILSIWTLNRVIYGPGKWVLLFHFCFFKKWQDLNFIEKFILCFLSIVTILLGIKPSFLFSFFVFF